MTSSLFPATLSIHGGISLCADEAFEGMTIADHQMEMGHITAEFDRLKAM